PGAPKSLYTWRSAPWLARCMRDSDAILRGIRPYIAKADADTTTRFTYGRGTTGLKSEAYCAGWILAGNLLEHGYTFRRLAKIPEAEMPRFVTASLNSMLGGTGRAPSPATHQPAGCVSRAICVRNPSPRRTWPANVSRSMLLPQTMTPTRFPCSVRPKGPIRAANAAAPPGSTASF